MPEIVCAQRTAEWLQVRRGRITASVAAGCLGLDPYHSMRKAWREIMGKKTQAEIDEYLRSRPMQWGVQFEASARLDYETDTGNLVQTCGFFVHPEFDWLGASPDGLIGTDGLAEIKCPTVPPEKVPVHHRIQCLVQLAVTGRQWCDYYAWGASGKRFTDRIFPQGIQGLIARLKRFYDAYVVTGIEPPRKKPRRRKKEVTACPLEIPLSPAPTPTDTMCTE